MGRKKKTRALTVLMNGETVGEWLLASTGTHEFTYAESWLSSSLTRPLSLSMPLRQEKYTGDIVYNWFDNLLPNNDVIRRRLRDRFAADTIQAFDLLAETGRDCVGAVQLIPSAKEPVSVRQIEAQPVSGDEIEQLLVRAVSPANFGKMKESSDEFRISLAGAQEKTAFLWHREQWHIPKGPTPTTHIFKLPLGHMGYFNIDMSTSVENEWLCSRILDAFDLDTARCDMARFGEQKTLIVKRFDRHYAPDGSWIMRLPQEDMCQATGTPPGKKYESDGGPGIKTIMNLLLGSSLPQKDRITFFRTQILFWLLCAIDGHAKNFSLFLGTEGRYRLTPLYDVLSAYPVMGHGGTMLSPRKVRMAMAVWGKNRHYLWSRIQREHFVATGHNCGLTTSACNDILDQIAKKIPDVTEQVSRMIPPDFPRNVADAIFDGLTERGSMLT